MHIVDRRLNPGGKSLANRQRFMRRAKAVIRKAVHESSGSRSIKDADKGGEVSLPTQSVHEPTFRRASKGGLREHLLPGNKEYVEGDTIPRPQGGGGGSGSEGSPDGEGQDDFRFALSQDEYVDLFLEDLELPDLAKRRVVDAEALDWFRAGYSVTGSPANLALNRTVRNSLSRRIAMRRPKADEISKLREEIETLEREGTDHERLAAGLSARFYFAHPSSSWERGLNENTNGLLRQYMPKGVDISGYSQLQLNAIARQLNERPRKTLGFKTPAEMFSESVALTG